VPFFVQESDSAYLEEEINFLDQEINVSYKFDLNKILAEFLLNENSSLAAFQRTIPLINRYISP
jgi:hypothetical protein